MKYPAISCILVAVVLTITGCGYEAQPVEVEENIELNPQALDDDESFETQLRTEVLPSGEYKLKPKPEVVHD